MKKVEIKLREALKQRRLSQTDLHNMTGIRQAAISVMARNKVRRIEFDHIEKIAEALSIEDMNELLRIIEEEDGKEPEE